jgi:tetratricopeptide (TPR) repeat protein
MRKEHLMTPDGRDRLDSFSADELLALARRDLDGGRIEEALLKLKKLIAGADLLVDALPYAARLYAQLGLMEKARDCYRRYLKVQPDATLESFELGITYFEGGEGAEAKKLWDKVLGSQPTHPPTLFYSGLLAAREGRIPDARRNLDVLFKSTPADNLYVTRGKELLRDLDLEAKAPAEALPKPAAAPYEAAKPGH